MRRPVAKDLIYCQQDRKSDNPSRPEFYVVAHNSLFLGMDNIQNQEYYPIAKYRPNWFWLSTDTKCVHPRKVIRPTEASVSAGDSERPIPRKISFGVPGFGRHGMLELSGVFGGAASLPRPLLSGCSTKPGTRAEKLKNPHPSGSLTWFSWIVARLGGWSGYTSRRYKPAGPKTIAHGLARLDGFIGGWALRSADMRLP